MNEVISTLFQVGFMVLVPFLFFLFRKDKSTGFLQYVGLYKPQGKTLGLVLLATVLTLFLGVGLALMNDDFKAIFFSPYSISGKLRAMGPSWVTFIAIVLAAGLRTSFVEELFFRGFIAKRLINLTGFAVGNFLQAIIFGLLHLYLMWLLVNTEILLLALVFVLSTTIGWILGYIKEKKGNGSIIPGWVAHGAR